MVRRMRIGPVVTGLWLAAAPAWAATYTVDKDHTTVAFKVRHLFSQVMGTFDQFEGTIQYEPGKPETWHVEAVAQTASVNTKNEGRDKHLLTADFFDAEKNPTLSFKSTQVTDVSGESAKLHGVLTIRGVEKPVVFDLQVHGVGKDPWGNVRSGFTATTRINRQDFGISWNKTLDTGGVLVGDEVEIILEVEGLQQPAL